MFISPKDNRSENLSNFSHDLTRRNTSDLLVAVHTSTTVPNTKFSTYPPSLIRSAAAISLELIQQTLNAHGNTTTTTTPLSPPTPTALFSYVHDNESAVDGNDTFVVTPRISSEVPIWLIPCYSVIFFFAIVGNLLVISTLMQNRRMRTITNVFLLNLAISDILLGVLCMPVTLVGTLLRHFIFGEFFCKLIQFSQAASVAVSSWTLVAISCERYYAICHPLRSRTWQTINHAYRIIGFIWFSSIICMTPIAIFSQLMPTSRQGLRKCREQWPEDTIAYERSYNIFLDLVLLVLPLLILCVAYILITRTLYVGMRAERAIIFGGYVTGDTPVKQHDRSPLEAIATVTKSSTAPTAITLRPSMLSGFNLKMSLRCHRRQASDNSVSKDGASETKNDIGYHQQSQQQQQQQQRQQQQQLKYYEDSNGAGDMQRISVSATSTKVPQSLFGLRVLSCADDTEQQRDLPSKQTIQQQQSLLHNYTASRLHVCSNNGHHTENRSATSFFADYQQQQQYPSQQQNRFTLRTSLPQHNSNQIHVQQQKPHLLQQSPLRTQHKQEHLMVDRRISNSSHSLRFIDSALRRSNESKNLESKKRVVKMLFVLVLEFFVCWTPLYVINTVAMFIGPSIYEYIDYTSICFLQLLAYSSSCCNPITYCFMNASFRRAFLDTFRGLHLRSSNNNSNDGASRSGIESWRIRRNGDEGCAGADGDCKRRSTNLATLMTSNSIPLTNNAIIVTNNASIHELQPPSQRN